MGFFFQIFTPVRCFSPSLCPNHGAQYYTQTDRHWAGDLIFQQSQPLFLHHHTSLQIPIKRGNCIFSLNSHSQNFKLVNYFTSRNKQNKTTRKIPVLFVLKQTKTNEEALLFSTMKTLEEHLQVLKPEIGVSLNFIKSTIRLEQSMNKIDR